MEPGIFGISNFGASIFGASNLGFSTAFGAGGAGAALRTGGSKSSSSSSEDPPLNALNAANPPRPSTAGIAASAPAGGPSLASFVETFLVEPELLLTSALAVFEFPPLLVAASYASNALSVPCGTLGTLGTTGASVSAAASATTTASSSSARASLARNATAPASAIAARRPKFTEDVASVSSPTTFARVVVVIARRRVVVVTDEALFVLLLIAAESILFLFAHAALVVIADTMVQLLRWMEAERCFVSFGGSFFPSSSVDARKGRLVRVAISRARRAHWRRHSISSYCLHIRLS